MKFPKFLDPRRIYQNPMRLLNPDNFRGGFLYGEIADRLLTSLGVDPTIAEAAQFGLSMPGGLVPKLGATVIGADLRRPATAATIYDERTGKLMPNVQADREIRIDRGEEDPFPTFDPFGNPPPGPYDHEFKVPSPDDPVLSLSSDGKGLVWVTRAQRDASLQQYRESLAREAEEKNSEDGPPLPETRPPTVANQEPASPTVANQEPVSSTSNNMQSELLKEATTMRRAKEMKELGIHGGGEAMNKGSAMHTWLSTHGELADNLIRDKRMREVRVAREFDRDPPTDARGLDGQMGNFEAFNANRQVG